MLIRSLDGQLLIVSSSDGFCSIISFNKEELGSLYTDSAKVEVMGIEEPVVQENIEEIPIKGIPEENSPLKIKQVTDSSEPPTKKRVQLVTLSSPKTKKHLNK